MNDSELEDQLRALSPAAPSADLAARIDRELRSQVTPTSGVLARPARPALAWRWLRDLGWAVTGAAAMLAAVMLLSRSPEKPGVSSAIATALPGEAASIDVAPAAAEDQAFEPAESSRELVSVKNSDEVVDTEDGPVREVRYTYVERLAWAHPATGAWLEIEVPREDVYFYPVALQ